MTWANKPTASWQSCRVLPKYAKNLFRPFPFSAYKCILLLNRVRLYTLHFVIELRAAWRDLY